MIKNKFLKLAAILCCACLAFGCAILGVNALPYETASAEETRTAVATYNVSGDEAETVKGYLYTNANDSTKYDLVISGEGAMKTGWTAKIVPWNSVRGDIVSVTIEEGVTNIGDFAFNLCTSLTAIEIPSTVTDIREKAFYGSGLTEVTIPETVKNVRANAFNGSPSNLKKIVFLGSPSITKSALNESTIIYGYKGSSAEEYATTNSRTFVALDAIFTQVSVTLGSDLSINYYAAITEEQAATATVNFTVNSYTQTGVTGTFYSEGVYLFRFTGVAPQWIADTVTATLSVDGEELETKTYSVQTYCNSLLSSTAEELGLSETKYAAMKVLVADLLSYGAAAQAYLTANGAENVGTTEITTVEGG
ncbi:MAG: leucine-rich repeat domain-containing protein [Clostridia bacterium]|nr:leucine-rich repeat domain-containing protein [Clostridia bacterium]